MGIVDLREWQWPQAMPSEDLMHSERDFFVSAKAQITISIFSLARKTLGKRT